MPRFAHALRRERHLERDVEPAARSVRSDDEIRQRRGIARRRARRAGTRNGASASSVTTHGEIVVAKFFARNGPSGWYSHAWMSRADQSFTRHRPKTCRSASSIGIGVAERVARRDERADLELVVEAPRRPERRRRSSPSRVWPRRTAHRRAAARRSTTRGRDSRSAPTCSSAAAGCRAGTCCPTFVAWWIDA